MAYGYDDRYRRSGGYRYSSRDRVNRRNRRNRKRNNMRRIRNRALIILTGLAACTLVVLLVVGVVRLITGFASSGSDMSPDATATTSAEKNGKKTSKNSKSKNKTNINADALSFTAPKIDDDGSAGAYDDASGLFIWDKKGFELFYGSDEKAEEYAELMNSAKKKLGSGIKVYSMIIPNHTEMGLPDRFKNTDDGIVTNSQAHYIKTSYKALDGVEPINIYNKLSEHCNDYIYFSSDHHWTGLGSYYAYTAFAEATKQTPVSLGDLQENKIEGFTGSFTELAGDKLDEDTVYFWSMPFDVQNTITQSDGNVVEIDTMYYWGEGPGSNSYGVFLYGDNPLEVIKSSSPNANGKKILIIHESYGNALVPYYAANYSEVHSIDFRSFDGDLKNYCEENEIDEVLFANGVMSSATETQLESMRGLIG